MKPAPLLFNVKMSVLVQELPPALLLYLILTKSLAVAEIVLQVLLASVGIIPVQALVAVNRPAVLFVVMIVIQVIFGMESRVSCQQLVSRRGI